MSIPSPGFTSRCEFVKLASLRTKTRRSADMGSMQAEPIARLYDLGEPEE
jgi:hypothetical protein